MRHTCLNMRHGFEEGTKGLSDEGTEGGALRGIVWEGRGNRGEEDAPGKVRRLSVKGSRGEVRGCMFGARLQNRGNRRSLSWPIRYFRSKE